ncbi:MAG: hypothetical protein QXV84_03270, partial [Conexivisphaerales archaeon]
HLLPVFMIGPWRVFPLGEWVEGTFSVIKRVFNKYVSAKFVNMAREMPMKACICNGFVKAMT